MRFDVIKRDTIIHNEGLSMCIYLLWSIEYSTEKL